MFERYTEKARRTIFFARYEASQFGCSYIESEHLLLGLLREDKVLAIQLLASNARIEAIRNSITQHTGTGQKIATSVDLPLSHESKRALAYASEESVRMKHKQIDTPHLLLGLLREEKSFAAKLLNEQGLTLDSVREQVRQAEPPNAGQARSIARLDQWLAESEARGIWTVMPGRVGTTCFAIYAHDQPKENEKTQDMAPVEKLAQIRKRIDFIRNRMDRAIANHEFEKARSYSDEERRERESMRLLREQFNLEEPSPAIPLLWIEVLGDDRFTEVQKHCDDCMAEGVAEVWLLDPELKRAYTVNKTDGLRECKGEILRIGNPPLEMDLRGIFS